MVISPGLEAAIANLAKVTARTGADPGRVLHGLVLLVKWRNEVYPRLSPMQRYAVRVRLRQYREELARHGYADTEDAGAQ